ncbi:hypothetical protein C8Q72DRAFT_865134 [Fomitopsis betulina]|nr:hypothetical protein C8Q72DRAFT_865134 [Fomitopsis betulina]
MPSTLTGVLREEDLVLLRWGYKICRKFARRMPFYCGEYLPKHPQFPQGSKASCSADAMPVPMDAAPLQC